MMFHVKHFSGGDSLDNFVNSFVEFVSVCTPYVIVWRIGIYIVNFLLDCMTGGNNGKVRL